MDPIPYAVAAAPPRVYRMARYNNQLPVGSAHFVKYHQAVAHTFQFCPTGWWC